MQCLSESSRRELLTLARRAVVDAVSFRKIPDNIPREGIFAERCGVFVTAHVGGELRGCIGVTEGNEPLGEAIVRCAASAVTYDTRFAPVRMDELHDLRLDVSLLSPLAPIRPEEIVVGEHGLVVSDGRRRGLLLPQVATEHELSVEEFLGETCRKAGLARDAWRLQGTIIEGFRCEVFSEGEETNTIKRAD